MNKPSQRSQDGRIAELKTNLTLNLYLRAGAFWEDVRRARQRLDITSIQSLPDAEVVSKALPLGSPEGFDLSDQLVYLYRKHVPADCKVRSEMYSFVEWSPFLRACLMYDPPDDALEAFAKFGGPTEPPAVLIGEYDFFGRNAELARVLAKVTNARPKAAAHIVSYHDPRWLRQTEQADKDRYWHGIIAEMEKRLGTKLFPIIRKIEKENPSLQFAHRKYTYQPAIRVTAGMTEADVLGAFNTIKETQFRQSARRKGAPAIDDLTAVQCAAYRDKYGWTEAQVAAHYKWAVSEDEHGTPRRSVTARRYVKRGRSLINAAEESRNSAKDQ